MPTARLLTAACWLLEPDQISRHQVSSGLVSLVLAAAGAFSLELHSGGGMAVLLEAVVPR